MYIYIYIHLQPSLMIFQLLQAVGLKPFNGLVSVLDSVWSPWV